MKRIDERAVLDTHEARWRLVDARMQRSRLSDRAVANRVRATLETVIVAQTWFLAREIAAVFLGLNVDDVVVEADQRPLWGTAIPGTTLSPEVFVTANEVRCPVVFVRRVDGDLSVSSDGFFDAETEPYEDEPMHPYRMAPTRIQRSKRKARR